jgi:hypothetical protein
MMADGGRQLRLGIGLRPMRGWAIQLGKKA